MNPHDTEKAPETEEIDLKKNVGLADGVETDPALDKRITRKLDFHIMPWIFILWLLAFIDRSNIGWSIPRSLYVT